MRIAMFGPPGAGKGTQAALLEDRLGLSSISTGNLLRSAMREKTPLGVEAEKYVTRGKLVPSSLVRRLAESAVAGAGFDDFILDGYVGGRIQCRLSPPGGDGPLYSIELTRELLIGGFELGWDGSAWRQVIADGGGVEALFSATLESTSAAGEEPSLDDEHLEQLKALGYIQ